MHHTLILIFVLLVGAISAQFYHFSQYSNPGCFGDPFSFIARRINHCGAPFVGVSAIFPVCVGSNQVEIRSYDGPDCTGNFTSVIHTFGQCSFSNISSIISGQLFVGSCDVPLFPLDDTPDVFPGPEQTLPTVTAQIHLTDQTECGTDLPDIVLWVRNSGCSVSSPDGQNITFSVYDCSVDGQITQTLFTDSSCLNEDRSILLPENSCIPNFVGPNTNSIFMCEGGERNSSDNSTTVLAASLTVVLGLCCFVLIVIMAISPFVYQKLKHEHDVKAKAMKIKALEVPVLENVTQEEKIGSGQFGDVFRGMWATNAVALKAVRSENIEDFSQELKIMCELRHPHLLTFYGIYISDVTKVYIVTEYMPLGDLLDFLHKEITLSGSALLSFCIQIAVGMEHLHGINVVHRDLACRNVLVANNEKNQYQCKVADFGLSREIDEVYESSSRTLPVRWTAPEVIEYSTWTKGADVWSFGIVMWEIWTRGAVPYSGFSNEQVAAEVVKGLRVVPPREAPTTVGSLMHACWRAHKARPTFSELTKKLGTVVVANEGFQKQSEISSIKGGSESESVKYDLLQSTSGKSENAPPDSAKKERKTSKINPELLQGEVLQLRKKNTELEEENEFLKRRVKELESQLN